MPERESVPAPVDGNARFEPFGDDGASDGLPGCVSPRTLLVRAGVPLAEAPGFPETGVVDPAGVMFSRDEVVPDVGDAWPPAAGVFVGAGVAVLSAPPLGVTDDVEDALGDAAAVPVCEGVALAIGVPFATIVSVAAGVYVPIGVIVPRPSSVAVAAGVSVAMVVIVAVAVGTAVTVLTDVVVAAGVSLTGGVAVIVIAGVAFAHTRLICVSSAFETTL